MKTVFTLLIGLTMFCAAGIAQSQDRWEELGDRMSRKAERLGEKAEVLGRDLSYRLERGADRLVIIFENWSKDFERRWSDYPTRRSEYSINVEVESGVFLGVESMQISDAKAKKLGFQNLFGAYVTKVFPNSAASDAGLKPFDYIFGVNKKETSAEADLSSLLSEYSPGDYVTFHLIRDNKRGAFDVRLGNTESYDFKNQESPPYLGVSPADGEKEEDLDGVSVEVLANSPAARMGLKNGDVIEYIGNNRIFDWEDLTTAISSHKPGDKIEVKYVRGGKGLLSSGNLSGSQSSARIERDRTLFDPEDAGPRNRPVEPREWVYGASSRGVLGVYTSTVSREKAKSLGYDHHYGGYVTSVYRNSPAEKAGLMPFDYIIGIDKRETNYWNGVTDLLSYYSPGNKVEVHFIRDGKHMTLPVVLGDPDDVMPTSRNSCEDPLLGVNQASGRRGEGVRVSLVKNSTAWDLGLQNGDVILYINGYKIIDWTDLTTAVDMLSPGMTISVEYKRGEKTFKNSEKIKSYAETYRCSNCNCGRVTDVIGDIGDIIREEVETWGDRPTGRQEQKRPDYQVERSDETSSDFLKSKGVDISEDYKLRVDDLKIVQNDANGKFSVSFRLPLSGDTVVKLFNAAGRTVYEYSLGEFSGEFKDEIDIAQNGAGDYYLLVKQGDRYFSNKITLK